eukprot:gnl/MRDRNA2_/MRDRNA2_196599_c0_seq1.p1 gnl/MRDRNA2_/MRDRNA2_196599_c0~~gnl/MRDRNA2_/MRDRNA2_196599_c0_seq1.p1  ORF type:complete len:185 (-),score=30.34 gnl/MRDRNA2_/MRDRNA2_196599_c0_seq1:66-551(-)
MPSVSFAPTNEVRSRGQKVHHSRKRGGTSRNTRNPGVPEEKNLMALLQKGYYAELQQVALAYMASDIDGLNISLLGHQENQLKGLPGVLYPLREVSTADSESYWGESDRSTPSSPESARPSFEKNQVVPEELGEPVPMRAELKLDGTCLCVGKCCCAPRRN